VNPAHPRLKPLLMALSLLTSLSLPTSPAFASSARIEPGEWHRTTTFNIKNPIASKLLGTMQSDVCVTEATAKGGPLSVVTMDDGPECHLTSSTLGDGKFMARRICQLQGGSYATYRMTGAFTGQSIDFNTTMANAHGPVAAAPHTEMHRVGPCHPA
jgi:hypothetical protein